MPAFAAAKYSNRYQGVFLARIATRLPFRHPEATKRLARRFANDAAAP